jgi:hypothetical protein
MHVLNITHHKRMKPIALALAQIFLLTACAVNRPVETTTKIAAPAKPAAATNVVSVATTTPTPPASAMAAMGMGSGMPGPGEPRKYSEVITKDAKTARGMVLHHKIKDRHLFEIPEKLLGRDLLWSVEISQASAGGGFNGLPLGYRVLRFERQENRILMRSVSYQNRAIGDIKTAVDNVDLAPIVMSFPIEAEGSERSLDLRAEEKLAIEKEKAEKLEKEAKEAKEKIDKDKTKIADAASVVTDPVAKVDKVEKIDAVEKIEIKLPIEPVKPKDASLLAKDVAPAVKDMIKSATKESTKESPTKEKWPVIDVSRLLMSTSSDLIDARNLGPMGFGGVDPSRSNISAVKVFPSNVEARATLTFVSFPMPQMSLGGAPQMPMVARNPTRTAIVHYSISMLPETPMQGRYADDRVGYFTEPFVEYGGDRTGSRQREFITRYRLEKKDPTAALSEPIKPIIVYIAEEVPEKWKKPLMDGVTDWNVAFEQAGFKNAIVAKLAPTKKEDPLWDAEDARYSVIRWVALPIANAMGPHVHDPRSGEIISAHVIFWHDLIKYLEQLYFIQAGAADKRIDKLPIPDEVMGELLRSVATHEIGHTLGLRHNHRGATGFSVKSLRDPTFTSANGTVASIMSYGRFNSVAQPGDGVTSFVPKIADYDKFAIEWGYKPIDAKSAEDEIPTLDRLAARQISEPLLKFGGEDTAAFLDPEVITENIGKERIEATKLSLASLERAAKRLIPATTRLGEDYEALERTYYTLLSQRSRYIESVVKMIGGVRETRYLGGRGGDTFTRTSPKEQRAAMRYLLDEALITPKWLVDPNLLNRFAMLDVTAPVVNAQKRILTDMLQPIRFRVLEDVEFLTPGAGLSSSAYLQSIQKSIFRETTMPQPKVDIYRRELQRDYIEHLKAFSGEAQRFKNFNFMFSAMLTDLMIDLRPAAMDGLKSLQSILTSAEKRATDTASRQHFAQLLREVEKTLRIRGN